MASPATAAKASATLIDWTKLAAVAFKNAWFDISRAFPSKGDIYSAIYGTGLKGWKEKGKRKKDGVQLLLLSFQQTRARRK